MIIAITTLQVHAASPCGIGVKQSCDIVDLPFRDFVEGISSPTISSEESDLVEPNLHLHLNAPLEKLSKV